MGDRECCVLKQKRNRVVGDIECSVLKQERNRVVGDMQCCVLKQERNNKLYCDGLKRCVLTATHCLLQ